MQDGGDIGAHERLARRSGITPKWLYEQGRIKTRSTYRPIQASQPGFRTENDDVYLESKVMPNEMGLGTNSGVFLWGDWAMTPFGQKKNFTYEKIGKHGLASLCVGSSGQRKFVPLYGNLNTPLGTNDQGPTLKIIEKVNHPLMIS